MPVEYYNNEISIIKRLNLYQKRYTILQHKINSRFLHLHKEDILNSNEESDFIPKTILDWITRVGAIGTILVGIFGAFLPEENAKRFAWGVAFLLAIASTTVYFYKRHRTANLLKTAESLESLAPSATLRGLLPFEDGDELPGRSRDIQGINTLVISSEFQFGVLWGESGCGKTSLLRAGLVPKLRNEGFLPIYISKPTKNPIEAIRSTLLKEVPSIGKHSAKSLNHLLKLATPKDKKIVIIFDQFEEFFLTNRTPYSRASFTKWLGEIVQSDNLPVVFLLSIRSDFFAQLQNFAPQIPEPTSIRTTYQLQNFDTEQAKQIFTAAAKADGISFEPELIQAIIRELETEEFIRPAELQVVGTRLKRKNIVTLNRYETVGGARGILSSYISDEIKISINEQIARLVLRMMCADSVETKAPNDLSINEIVLEIRGVNTSGSDSTEIIHRILEQFVTSRILIRTDENKYNLTHDYLASYIRAATEGTETNTEKANRLLKKKIAEYKDDPRARIPFAKTRWIQKYATSDIKNTEKAQELIKKSKYKFYVNVIMAATILAFIYSTYFYYLTQAYYFSTENSFIVLRAGHPQFTFLPGFGKLVVRTGVYRLDLIQDIQILDEIDQGKLRGFWFQRVSPAQGGYQKWGEQLILRLRTEPRTQMLRWLGQSDRAKLLIEAVSTNPDISSNQHYQTIKAIGSIAITNPETITPEMVSLLLKIITDLEADTSVRSTAADTLGFLAQVRPELITPIMASSLLEVINSNQTDSRLSTSAVNALQSLAHANPEVITSDLLSSVLEIVVNTSSYYDFTKLSESLVQARPEAITSEMTTSLLKIITENSASSIYYDPSSRAVNALQLLIQAKPKIITSEIISSLLDIITTPQTDNKPSKAITTFGLLAQANPEVITPRMASSLIEIVTTPQANSNLHANAINTFGLLAKAKPDVITSETTSSLLGIITNPNADSNVRLSAINTLGLLAQVNPEIITSEMSFPLLEIISSSGANYTMRSSAINTLGLLAQAKPKVITPETISMLLEIINGPITDTNIRTSAINTLGLLSQAKPELITSVMLSSLLKIINDPNTDWNMRSSAIDTLERIFQSKPDVITTKTLSSLLKIITDPKLFSNLSAKAADTVGVVVQNKPEVITSELDFLLLEFITNSEPLLDHSFAIISLQSLARARPELITPDMTSLLIAVTTDPRANLNARTGTIEALKILAQAHPESITPNQITMLIDSIVDLNKGQDVRLNSVNALRVLVEANPSAITKEILPTLINNLSIGNNTDYFRRYNSAHAIGPVVQADLSAITPDRMETMLALLEAADDSAGRYIAGYALFEISIADPSLENMIRQKLNNLQLSPQPHLRMNAVRILEMMAILDLANEAQINPSQIENIKLKLVYVKNFSQFGTSNEREDGLSFAASIVLTEIEEIQAGVR